MGEAWRVQNLRRFVLGFIVCGLVAASLGVATTAPAASPPATHDTADPGSVTEVTFNGSAVTNNSDGRRVLWQSESFTAVVDYVPPEQGSYEVCLWAATPTQTVCQEPVFNPQNRSTLRLDDISWPPNETGSVGFVTELRAGEEVIDRHHREIIVLKQNTSYDGDSLDNRRELDLNTSVLIADTDQDGLKDGVEIRTYHTDPLNPDTDYDGLNDLREIELGTNPNDADTDDDGLDDGREIDVGASPFEVDTDGDGLDDPTEVRLGTDPDNPLTPFFLAIGGIAVFGVVALFVSRRWGLVPVPWVNEPRSILVLPSLPWHDADTRTVDSSETEEATTESTRDTVPGQGGDQAMDYVETDTERVLKILNQHNGRIRQTELVDANDWSASKVSRLLSEMESDGLVSKVTIGRENIVTLPGEEPAGGSDDDS